MRAMPAAPPRFPELYTVRRHATSKTQQQQHDRSSTTGAEIPRFQHSYPVGHAVPDILHAPIDVRTKPPRFRLLVDGR